MKKTLLLLTVSLLLIGCGQSEQESINNVEPTDINVDQEVEDQLTITEVTEEDESEREVIENDTALYADRDQAEVSISDCEDFQDEGSKQNCKDQVNLDIALSQRDASKCESILSEDIRQVCQRELQNS